MRFIGVMLVLVGCQSSGVTAPDAASSPDGGVVQSLGMVINWGAAPALPGPVDNDITVTDASFQVSLLEIIGDAGTGDERTSHAKYMLTWDATGSPAQDSFPDAPAGVYSKITLELAPDGLAPYAYEIDGTWQDNRVFGGDPERPFRVIGLMAMTTSVECNETLRPGGSATIDITVGLLNALEGIDFHRVPQGPDGVPTLIDGDPQMGNFRGALMHGFQIDSSERGRRAGR